MLLLIRHAKPLINYGKCGYEDALERLTDYNTTSAISLKEIEDFKKSESYKLISTLDFNTYTSPLNRAYLTSCELFKECKILDDLIELDLELVDIPYIQLEVLTWFLISRIAWFLKIKDSKETPSEAKQRVGRLIKYINPSKNIAFVCHGGVIHYLKQNPYIKKNYKLMHVDKYDFLTVEVYFPK